MINKDIISKKLDIISEFAEVIFFKCLANEKRDINIPRILAYFLNEEDLNGSDILAMISPTGLIKKHNNDEIKYSYNDLILLTCLNSIRKNDNKTLEILKAYININDEKIKKAKEFNDEFILIKKEESINDKLKLYKVHEPSEHSKRYIN